MVRAPYPPSLSSSSTACRITSRERAIRGSTAGFARDTRTFCGLDDAVCCLGTAGFRTRTRRAICGRVRLKQLDEVFRWVFQQDLPAAGALNHVTAEVTTC